MTYVIVGPRIDVVDRTCVVERPVDCVDGGARALDIHPDERVDRGACEPVCPAEAIFYQDDLPERSSAFTLHNGRFPAEPLPGTALESPGGPAKLGRIGTDTALVASYPPQGG
jgi:NAD-dependent dihydropyrimidine dehydrogenase PreA subunit